MIVTESDLDSKSTLLPEASTGPKTTASNSGLPPPYLVNSPQSLPVPPTRPLLSNKVERREPVWKRFLKAFSTAIFIYILLGVLAKILTSIAEKHFIDGVPSTPRKEDGRVVSCANETWNLQTTQPPFPNIPPYTSTSSFNIPVSSSHIFLFSRGSYGHGNIKMQLSNRSDDMINVEVITRYYSLEARDRCNVCHLARDKDGQGLGIYTPRRLYPDFPRPSDQIAFDITVSFPRHRSLKYPLIINSLETNMGIWSHDIAPLENYVMFKSLSLSGSNTYIRVDSISAEFAQLKTRNAQITGHYNVSDSLSLQTSNAAIKVTLRLENNNGNKATRVKMKTTNARIESPITLISTDNSSRPSPAAFSITSRTGNSPINVTFSDAPSSPFAHLSLDMKTFNAAVYTRLHPTYEGSIFLTTSVFIPSLMSKTTTTDPSGERRHRNVDIRRVLRGALAAGVWWGDDPTQDEGKGTVVVTTSNGYNNVELG